MYVSELNALRVPGQADQLKGAEDLLEQPRPARECGRSRRKRTENGGQSRGRKIRKKGLSVSGRGVTDRHQPRGDVKELREEMPRENV